MFNWFIGLFIHDSTDSKHGAEVRYRGLTCTGYVCSECGYKWYEKKKLKKK